ncbi:hypothetical protein L6164_037460 [Bauhinia variegata]|uniref:Uncharacterized protein n=1 Tax=Bauhinia variegata TaxID=167791 RepID=A0ACB9KKB9_BAUVA|nr:hypothetical protein L6164_037460 [Bauhinia variegata]
MADSLVEHQPIKINAENKVKEVITTLPANEGSNSYSYSKNSYFQSPEELQDKDSPAWNKGRIHYTNAPKEVVEAYATQFAEDARNFLGARAKELAPGGMLVRIMQGEEITKLVEENGYLGIERMELPDPAPWLKHKSHISVPNFITHVRATLEGNFSSHFGDEITDEMPRIS